MAGRIVSDRLPGHDLFQLPNPRDQAPLLASQRRTFLCQGLLPPAFGRSGRGLLLERFDLAIKILQLRRLVRQLFDTLLVVVAVEEHVLQLAVQHADYVCVFLAERTGAKSDRYLRRRRR